MNDLASCFTHAEGEKVLPLNQGIRFVNKSHVIPSQQHSFKLQYPQRS